MVLFAHPVPPGSPVPWSLHFVTRIQCIYSFGPAGNQKTFHIWFVCKSRQQARLPAARIFFMETSPCADELSINTDIRKKNRILHFQKLCASEIRHLKMTVPWDCAFQFYMESLDFTSTNMLYTHEFIVDGSVKSPCIWCVFQECLFIMRNYDKKFTSKQCNKFDFFIDRFVFHPVQESFGYPEQPDSNRHPVPCHSAGILPPAVFSSQSSDPRIPRIASRLHTGHGSAAR